MNKRCFVISPIGDEDSDVRKHSDAVFRFIIEPAMDECGLTAVRADHLAQPGRISDHMFDEILNDQLCIAVLTGHNPNVFYELAIAQAADRPVILLIERGQHLPFDVKDLRSVYYDLWPEPLVDRVYAKRVVEQIKELEAAGWKTKMPFGEGLTPLGSGHEGAFQFFTTSEDFGRSDAWMELLRKTERAFEIMGIGLHKWRHTRGFSGTLAEKAAAGCKVRLLVMHPENPSLREVINDSVQEDSFDSVVDDAQRIFKFFSKLEKEHENVHVRQMLKGCPHLQLLRTDRHALCIPYLYSDTTRAGPLLKCEREHHLYGTLEREFESLWRANEPTAG